MLIEINTTCGSQAEAQKIAKMAVSGGLCACVHISKIESFYSWDNEVQNDTEFKLTFKTIESRYSDIAALIKKEHSYDLPAIYTIPVTNSSNEYSIWVINNSMKR